MEFVIANQKPRSEEGLKSFKDDLTIGVYLISDALSVRLGNPDELYRSGKLRAFQRCSECSHISKYTALAALLFLALCTPQRAEQP